MLAIGVKDVLRKEGVISLLKRGSAFLAPYFFQYGTFYLYEHTMKERNEADFVPKVDGVTVKIISTNQQADKLAADGFDFRSYWIAARRRLEKGAVAICIFVGRELAHVGWVAMTAEAKNTFDPVPYQVDFLNKQACTGGTLTLPKYEGKGLMKYGYYKRFQFLWERGIITSRNAVETNNIVSQKVHAKFSPQTYGKGRLLKILWWQLWRETPYVSINNQE